MPRFLKYLPFLGLTLFAAPDGAAAGGLVPELVPVPGGAFIAGSDGAEREAAYRLDEAAYGHGLTREQRWYEGERPRPRRASHRRPRLVILPTGTPDRRPRPCGLALSST